MTKPLDIHQSFLLREFIFWLDWLNLSNKFHLVYWIHHERWSFYISNLIHLGLTFFFFLRFSSQWGFRLVNFFVLIANYLHLFCIPYNFFYQKCNIFLVHYSLLTRMKDINWVNATLKLNLSFQYWPILSTDSKSWWRVDMAEHDSLERFIFDKLVQRRRKHRRIHTRSVL